MRPGRGAARSGAPQIRDRLTDRAICSPGSAAHHFVLRCARDTTYFPCIALRQASHTFAGVAGISM